MHPEPPYRVVPDPGAVTPGGFTTQEIEGIFGGLGSGKSNHAFSRFIWPELTAGDRTIVTNLPVNLDRLRELLQRRTARDGSEVARRIRLLTDEQASRFYLHRGLKGDVWWDARLDDIEEGANQSAGRELAIKSYNQDHERARPAGGVLYVIDEAHKYFRARSFQKFSLVAEWYFTHVRKQGDCVVLCSPHPMQIDTFIRHMFSNVWMMRNAGKERFLTFFRGPKFIRWRLYTGPLDSRMELQARGQYMLDRELADCYDTAGGAALVGGDMADKNRVVKGMPFWSLWTGAVAVCVLFFGGLWLGGRYFVYRAGHPRGVSAVVVGHAVADPAAGVYRPVSARAEVRVPVTPVGAASLPAFWGVMGRVDDCSAVVGVGQVVHGHCTDARMHIFVSDDGVVYRYGRGPDVRPAPATSDVVRGGEEVVAVTNAVQQPALGSVPVSAPRSVYRPAKGMF